MELEPEVFILESLKVSEETHIKEGEILSRTLRLAGKKKTVYHYLRTRQEFEYFVKKFKRSPHRYLHISCHGNIDVFATTLDDIGVDEMVTILAPAIDGRRLFLSSCYAADPQNRFATRLMESSGCKSVVAPVSEIGFADAAVFWSTFYHLMFKRDLAKQNTEEFPRMSAEDLRDVLSSCARLIGEEFRGLARTKSGNVRERVYPEADE